MAVFTYLWSFQVYEPEKSKVSEGCLSAVATPVIRRNLWDQRFSATMGIGAQTP